MQTVFSVLTLLWRGKGLHYWLFCCVFTAAAEAIEIESWVLFEWLLSALQCSSAGAGRGLGMPWQREHTDMALKELMGSVNGMRMGNCCCALQQLVLSCRLT